MTFQSCVAKDHWWAYSSCQFARNLRITPRRNTITREQPTSPRVPHKEISQPINPRSFNLLKIVNWLVCVYFIYRANCLYKENYTYNGHCWSLNKDFLLSITVKICYDNTGNIPYKGRNFNTQTFGKMYLFVFCMIGRHWFQTKLLLHVYIA